MSLIELFLLAVGLSMDAFAISVCAGLGMSKVTFRNSLIVGLYFGFFQAAMPLIGYFAASLFADNITSYGHWIAFALLGFLGGRMIYGSFIKENPDTKGISLKPSHMLPLAIATSVDALAVGVSFASLQISIVPAASFIGVTTLLLSMLGVKAGNVFGLRFKSKAELVGGVILVLIGFKVLFDHLI